MLEIVLILTENNLPRQWVELKSLNVPFRERGDVRMPLCLLVWDHCCENSSAPFSCLERMSQNVLLVSLKSAPWGLVKSLIRLKLCVR